MIAGGHSWRALKTACLMRKTVINRDVLYLELKSLGLLKFASTAVFLVRSHSLTEKNPGQCSCILEPPISENQAAVSMVE